MADLNEVTTLQGMVEAHPKLCNEHRLRHQIRNRETNGLAASGAISKRAGVWMFHVPRYFAWLFGEKAAA